MRLILSAFIWLAPLAGAASEPKHGYAFFGKLKYPSDMTHFDYANPHAPKGGRVRLGFARTFNNLNPYVDKGVVALLAGNGGLVCDPLMTQSQDELASWYTRLAETVEVADDLSRVTYTLRRNAHWHDGKPVTVDDALWTFNTLKEKGSASWRSANRDIERIEQTGPWSFTFHFRDEAEKTPHLVSQTGGFTPLPKHYWEVRRIDETTIEPPLCSGPYRVAQVDVGHKEVLERDPDYWGRDLPVHVGHFNFDSIEMIYFFDDNVMLQAMRAGLVDYYRDQNEADFATAYDFAGYHAGLFKKETYTMGNSYGMHYATVFNLRRPLFQDVRVREALTLAYNFEWANRVYWYEGMARNNSYFARSGMQAEGLPSRAELELLEPFREQLPERVFTEPVALPKNAPFGRNRETLQQADALLKQAGWIVRDFERVHEKTGEPLAFDLVITLAIHERMLVPYVDSLKRLGIQANLRRVEANLMTNRLRRYDYDMTVQKLYTFKVPYPSRMRSHFTSQYADTPYMRNYAGIKNPVVDFLVERVVAARSEAAMNAAGRALDRVLLWNFYVIPDGHPVGRHLVYWDRFGHPPLGVEHMNWTGFPQLWWHDRERSARIDAGIAALEEAE